MKRKIRYTLKVVVEVDAVEELEIVAEVIGAAQEYGTAEVTAVELLTPTDSQKASP